MLDGHTHQAAGLPLPAGQGGETLGHSQPLADASPGGLRSAMEHHPPYSGGVRRAMIMYGSSGAPEKVRNVVTKTPASAGTKATRCLGGRSVRACWNNSTQHWPCRLGPHGAWPTTGDTLHSKRQSAGDARAAPVSADCPQSDYTLGCRRDRRRWSLSPGCVLAENGACAPGSDASRFLTPSSAGHR
jgi:hypothetical protein